MTVPGNGGEPQVQPPDDGGQGQNDALGQYAGYLKDVPEQFHPQVLEGFKKTDSYWQNKLNEAQSQFTPYKPLTEKYEAPYLQAAAAMLDELQQNPQAVLPWLAGELGVNLTGGTPTVLPQQGQVGGNGNAGWGQDQSEASDWTQQLPPEVVERLNKIDQLEQLAELTGQTVLKQQQDARMAEELAQFDQLLGQLATKYGKFDEDWVLSKIENGKQPEEAVKAYHDFVQNLTAQQAGMRAPRVLGSGGGLPSNQTDVTTLTQRQTKDLVAQMVQAANREG